MNNHSMQTADRFTHFKIVVLSLAAGILVAGIAIANRPQAHGMHTRFDIREHAVRDGSMVNVRADIASLTNLAMATFG
ncbi:MAG TPA: hypothetical protein VMH84_11415 [Xanthobacteraceae bacterium]|nr:hypothetical protein [Xanthobacteraceae bacterium]